MSDGPWEGSCEKLRNAANDIEEFTAFAVTFDVVNVDIFMYKIVARLVEGPRAGCFCIFYGNFKESTAYLVGFRHMAVLAKKKGLTDGQE